ncbi:MAG TPA: BlaI/MecI/CopY family transcriptional regulator [Vicinamibacterales bacterium]|nr:BlaI/MecI/CopY family transcriptional regulator [Vicinamibacterales bacterium]
MAVPHFRLWGFKSPRDLAGAALGALEQRVMDLVWTDGEVTVRDAQARLDEPVAYTTLMTTLDRLFKKGLLNRRKVGRAFAYAAAVSREELQRAMAAGLLDNLLAGRRPPLPALSSLVDAVGEHDRDLLDELERLVQEKRRALEKQAPQ